MVLGLTATEVCDDGALEGDENMARDRALLERGSGCRVYQWNGVWVSLGRFQNPERALTNPASTQWVLRPTGGRAVLHGHDVTVSIAATLDRGSRSTGDIYRRMTLPLIAALRACGLPARLASEASRIGGIESADCFAFNSPWDVIDERDGTKACGCALRIGDRAALLQASVPFRAASPEAEGLVVGYTPRPAPEWDAYGLPNALRQAARQ